MPARLGRSISSQIATARSRADLQGTTRRLVSKIVLTVRNVTFRMQLAMIESRSADEIGGIRGELAHPHRYTLLGGLNRRCCRNAVSRLRLQDRKGSRSDCRGLH